MAWGYTGGISRVPRQTLPAGDRLLCDRCATQAVGLVAHCAQCGWDCCSSCVSTLRQQCQQSAAVSGAVPVTCCNPACPSVVGPQSSPAARELEQRCVARGDLLSVSGAAKLKLVVLLPADMAGSLGKLQQLAQVRRGKCARRGAGGAVDVVAQLLLVLQALGCQQATSAGCLC